MREIGLSGLLLDDSYSGTAVYSRNLMEHLPQVAPEFAFHAFIRRAADLPIGASRIGTPFAGRRGRVSARMDKLAWESVALPVASALRRQVLLHSLHFSVPPIAASPVVVTIHDLVPLVTEGHHRDRMAALYSDFVVSGARRAAAVITVSEHSKSDIVRVLGVPAGRVHVTPEGIHPRFHPDAAFDEGRRVRSTYRLPERYVLYLGGAEKRKGIATLVRAWGVARDALRRSGVRLVIVARFPTPDALYPDVPGLIRELGLERDVLVVPSVADADLPAVYRQAQAFCYPSWYEGFGLPPLEAMACGTPVLASNATSLPEVVGDAGLLLPPHDEDAWADALERVARDELLRADLGRRGVRRAGRFTWRRTAELTAEVYRTVLP